MKRGAKSVPALDDRQKRILRQLRELARALSSGRVFDEKTGFEINTAWARVFMGLKES